MAEQLRLGAYRFSIAWSRILPEGRGEVNEKGVAFYDALIDALVERGIEAWVTLYHWDLPQRLEDEYGGWLGGRRVVEDFGEYARVCFERFGDRVKRWVTVNEPWSVSVIGYSNGEHAPGRNERPGIEPYLAAHNLLLAHAKAYRIYKSLPASTIGGGMMGLSNCADFRYPRDPASDSDVTAAQRAMEFQLGWFYDPVAFGEYPASMRDRLGKRLPRFTPEEREMVMGSSDFLGVNHYSSLLASEPAEVPRWGGYWADVFVDFSGDEGRWETNSMGWSIVPEGCRDILLWIRERYGKDVVVYVTENGSSFEENGLDEALHDTKRRDYFEGYISAMAEAMVMGVDVRGYFAWSLMDNFEWQFGYDRKFGLWRVDFEGGTLKRTPKLSSFWYRDTITINGANIKIATKP